MNYMNKKPTNFCTEVLKSLSNSKNFKKNPIYPKLKDKVAYKISNKYFIPESSGVYFVHDLRGFLYIGETKNLQKRFLQHLQKEKNRDLINSIKNPFGDLNFYWINTNSKLEAIKLQNYWIRVLRENPFKNKLLYKHNS